MSDIVVKNLSKSYGANLVLDNFSATFPQNEITCIMGQSGCGKTTLLNILMGLLSPDSGEITGITKKLAPIFQEDRLCENFNIAANIRLTSRTSIDDEVIANHLAHVGLMGLEDKKILELSGGMKRRIAIVRAILSGNDIIIMDEPFKGLDEATRKITAEYILNNSQNKTIIMVTHDIDEVQLMNGHLLIMKGLNTNEDNDKK